MLLAIGSARARAGRRDEFLAAARTVVSASRSEDGCHAYGFYADLTDEDVIVSLETWRDQEALDAHMARPHTQTFLAHVAELVDGPPTIAIHAVPDPTHE